MMSISVNDVLALIKQQISTYPLILYMKGTPSNPACKFSTKAAQILQSCGVEFAHVNVLENAEIRSALPQYSNWPTFPQLYCKGELIGGCDIIKQLYETGDLQKKISET